MSYCLASTRAMQLVFKSEGQPLDFREHKMYMPMLARRLISPKPRMPT